ncbi:MAG: L,D-transpeptidase family protein [Gemmatimonadota bacterium]|nr:L,D-transpeptidase family protein [Gemmatimonadota bacterium]
MSIRNAGIALLVAAVALGCAEEDTQEGTIALEEGDDTTAVTYWDAEEDLTAEDIERGRLDMSWREAVEERNGPADSAPSSVPSDRSMSPPDSAELKPSPIERRSPLTGPMAPVEVRADTIDFPESFDDFDRLAKSDTTRSRGAERDTIDLPPVNLPLSGDVQGPSVMYVQVLLDRSPFSPGILDGKWGKNTEKAVYWLQDREGIEPTGTVDSITFHRLYALAGRPDRYVRTVTLTEEDVSGPFVDLSGDIYAKAELECTCYGSVREKVSERFHSSPDLLDRLNPDVDLMALEAGDTLRVPNVRKSGLTHERNALASAGPEGERATRQRGGGEDASARRDTGAGGQARGDTATRSDTLARGDTTRPSPAEDVGEIAKLVISGKGFYLHAVDSDGRIVRHYPTTLGSEYAPSPQGDYSVAAIAFAPWFHWKPDLLTGEDPSKPDARIPPGPNSPVGLVWMQLSKPHYGIHGTSAPATIGYVTSHGCIRLTNWDAVELAHEISAGVPVEFRDVTGRSQEVALVR